MSSSSSSSSSEDKIRIEKTKPPLSDSKKPAGGGLSESKKAGRSALEGSKMGSVAAAANQMLRASKKKKEKGAVDGPTYELDLDTLDIIEVTQSSDSDDDAQVQAKPTYKADKDIPVFDFMPDEVILNIYNNLDEKQSVIFGAVCHRFSDLLNDNEVWQHKAKGWTNIQVSKPGDGEQKLKEYYVAQYKENVNIQKRKQRTAKDKKRTIKMNKRTKQCFKISRFLWLRRVSMEIPLTILLLFWCVLVAVRADNFMFWNWHAVYSPAYFAYFWFFCGCIATDVLSIRLEIDNPNIDVRTESLMTFILEHMSPFTKLRKMTLYMTWLCSLAWLILVADYQNENSFLIKRGGSAITLVPLIVYFVYIMIALYWHCKQDTYEACEKFMAVMFLVCCFVWLYFPVWLKADNWTVPGFSWWAAFHPYWIVLFFLLCMLIPATLFTFYFWLISGEVSFHSQEGQMIFGMGLCGWGWVSVFIWIGFIAANLEWEDLNVSMWPWCVSFIPLFVAELALVFGCIWMNKYLNENW